MKTLKLSVLLGLMIFLGGVQPISAVTIPVYRQNNNIYLPPSPTPTLIPIKQDLEVIDPNFIKVIPSATPTSKLIKFIPPLLRVKVTPSLKVSPTLEPSSETGLTPESSPSATLTETGSPTVIAVETNSSNQLNKGIVSVLVMIILAMTVAILKKPKNL